MQYPVKKVKYSGKRKCHPGEALVYMPDGSVITATEVFAGVVTGNNEGEQKEIEFYTEGL